MNEFRVNEYLTLKLERDVTNIYVRGQRFNQCKYLLLNLDTNKIRSYDSIRSIDEAAETLNRSMEGSGRLRFNIPPETEFWGHCSNLQAWYDNNYDTRILHRNLAFPLLKELTRVGDPIAKKVFKEEIASRLVSGHSSVITYLKNRGYLNYLNDEEIATLMEDMAPKIFEVDSESHERIEKYFSLFNIRLSSLNVMLEDPTSQFYENVVLALEEEEFWKDAFSLLRDLDYYNCPAAKIMLEREVGKSIEFREPLEVKFIIDEGYLEYFDPRRASPKSSLKIITKKELDSRLKFTISRSLSSLSDEKIEYIKKKIVKIITHKSYAEIKKLLLYNLFDLFDREELHLILSNLPPELKTRADIISRLYCDENADINSSNCSKCGVSIQNPGTMPKPELCNECHRKHLILFGLPIKFCRDCRKEIPRLIIEGNQCQKCKTKYWERKSHLLKKINEEISRIT